MYRLDLTLMTPDRARCAQSVCQLFHGPAPRSPLRRLSFLLRRSRFNTGTSLPRRRGLVPSMMPYSRACWPCLCLLPHLGRQISKKDIPMRYPSHKLKKASRHISKMVRWIGYKSDIAVFKSPKYRRGIRSPLWPPLLSGKSLSFGNQGMRIGYKSRYKCLPCLLG